MTLDKLTLNCIYDKAYCNVAEEFYLPCMNNSSFYYRSTGYFSSSIYLIVWSTLQDFIDRGGHIRIICSPLLSNEDKAAIVDGVHSRSDEILSKQIMDELNELLKSDKIIPTKLLTCLVAKGIVDIKLAVMNNDSIFHDKVGVFGDEMGNIVGFRGTMNETYKGLSSDGNSESVDVYANFSEASSDRERAKRAFDSFKDLWNNEVPPIEVYDLPTSIRKKFLEISENENFDDLLKAQINSQNSAKKTQDTRKLRNHQSQALTSWYNYGRRGILEHATGSGKTFTAICAIRESLAKNEIPFVLVPSTALLQQWKKELDFALSDVKPTIYQCGDGHTDWKKNLSILSRFVPDSTDKLIILSVMATASTNEFLSKFKGGNHIFMVADEVHRLGSSKYRNILNIETGPRLGLSATPQRFGDPDGTYAIYSYFEHTLEPKYTLHDAIQDNVLTQYKYYPTPVSLTPEEQDEWNAITKKIKKRSAILNNSSKQHGNYLSDNTLKSLLIARSRILKNASEKVDAAIQIIEENYKEGQKWIVYCDNIDNQLETVINRLSKRYRVLQYHSRLSDDERKAVMNYFDINGGILVSVKCLDEGVDIPSVSHALIMASSKNPREFIQRRGRVLRKYDGKQLAHLYDLIVMPFINEETTDADSGLSIIESELARAIQFGKESPFPKCVVDLNNIAIDYNLNIDDLANLGYDCDEYGE